MSNTRNQLRRLLYDLKREYPTNIDLYRETQSGYNTKTGQINVDRQKWNIKRGVLLPSLLQIDFKYSIPFPGSATGGLFQVNDRQLIIDGKDLPKEFEIDEKDYIVYEHQRFEIVKVTELDEEVGWYLIIRESDLSIPYEIIDSQWWDILVISEQYSGTI